MTTRQPRHSTGQLPPSNFRVPFLSWLCQPRRQLVELRSHSVRFSRLVALSSIQYRIFT